MKTFTATCADGFTKTTIAETQDEAVMKFMGDADFQMHVKDKHPDLAGKSMDEMKAMMAQMIHEVA